MLRLRAVLEPEHMDEFVAIEPESGNYSRAGRCARPLELRAMHTPIG